MKGDYRFGILLALVLLVVLVMLSLGMINTAWGKPWERIPGFEEYLATPVDETEKLKTLQRFPTDRLPLTEKRIEANDFYVSEIACDIATKIYSDFTTFGEERPTLFYNDPSNAFIETSEMRCEFSSDTSARDYVCIVGFGSFILDGDKTLTIDDINNLKDEGCCETSTDDCGCTHDARLEFKLDEVCVNEFLNISLFPKGLDPTATFCTSDPLRYLRVDEQRLKFGNRDCFVNEDNDEISMEGWDWDDPATCRILCDAGGGGLLVEDYDRIMEFWADNISSEYQVNDSFITLKKDYPIYFSDNRTVLQGRNYFYNVLWFNKAKRYAIIFIRVPHYETKTFATEGEFADFLDNFFGLSNARVTTAGRYWPELATVYNGTVTLPEINIDNIKSSLKGVFNVYVDDEDCFSEADCLNYPIEDQIWGEWLQTVNRDSDILWETNDESPIIIKKYLGGDVLPAGEYRLVIRNWYSGLFYEDTERVACDVVGWIPLTNFCNYGVPSTCEGIGRQSGCWCRNENIREPGERIIYAWDCPPGYEKTKCCCISPSNPLVDEHLFHYTVKRYVDKAIILISTS